MAHGFEIEIPPEQQSLFRALTECGLGICPALQAFVRLTEPPESLHQPAADRINLMNSLIEATVDFDRGMAARMLRLGEIGPKPNATWKELTPAERKRAKRGRAWALDAGLESTPQGRPSVIDSALVLYCSRVIAESCEQPRFHFSRRTGGGPPKGPMWRTLMIALPLAETYLARIDGTIAPRPREIVAHAETISDILTTAHSKDFREYCKIQQLGVASYDVAEHPATFRYAIAHARRTRERKLPAKPRVP
jgi:hypothetical protein